jgi:type II secretory pathway pseudopilin PulG
MYLRRPQQTKSASRSSDGITLVELLVAVLIIGGVLAILVNVSIGQMRSNRRAIALNAVETAISADLAWLRNYAQIWKLDAGPFNLTTSQTQTASYTINSSLNYDPGAACDDIDANDNPIPIANVFLRDASSVATSPARPYTVPSTPASGPDDSTRIDLPPTAGDFKLTRTITIADGGIGSSGNTILVRYNLSGSEAPALDRSTSILIAASAWCY